MRHPFGEDNGALDLFPAFDDAGRYGNIDGRRRGNDIEDLSTSSPDEGIESHAGYVGSAVEVRRLRIVFIAIYAGLFIVLGRTMSIQLTKGEEYRQEAETNRIRTERITSERGVVYDRRGTPLVTNTPILVATITPADLPASVAERRKTLAALAEIIDEPPATIEERLATASRGTEPVPVSEELSHDQAVRLSIAFADEPSVAVATANRRNYAFGSAIPSLSHVIGYEGRVTAADLDRLPEEEYSANDTVGKAGVERSYEPVLRGSFGVRRIEVDARGGERRVIEERQPGSGKSLVLSIDAELQRFAEQALRDALRFRKEKRGSVIVLEPKTGEVLALVSLPAFDDNAFSNGIGTDAFRALVEDPDKPLFPRAIAASLPAGSTFKLMVGAAALEEKIVDPSSSILSSGGIAVDRWFFPDWKAGGHGPTNLAKAIAESVNTYFYVVGGGLDGRQGLGVNRIKEYASRFGFGKELGIDLPGEGRGFLPSPAWKQEQKGERWYIGDTYHMAIGQGDVLVTPLQIAAMTAVFANGGDLVAPRVVNAVTSADGGRKVIEPDVLRADVVSASSVDAVRRGMRLAVTSGSARSLGDLPIAVAAKTGTAQWKDGADPHAWFTSFGPYKDPSVVITVVIEEGGEGSATAAPVAKAIYAWLFGRGDKARILDTPVPEP